MKSTQFLYYVNKLVNASFWERWQFTYMYRKQHIYTFRGQSATFPKATSTWITRVYHRDFF